MGRLDLVDPQHRWRLLAGRQNRTPVIPYLVMTYYPARFPRCRAYRQRRSAASWLKRCVLGEKLVGALENRAPRAEILHRDIKPGNILYNRPTESPALSGLRGSPHVTGAFKDGYRHVHHGSTGISPAHRKSQR
jgi:serine/threonine protein kinase